MKKKKQTKNPNLPLLSPKYGVTKRSRGVFPPREGTSRTRSCPQTYATPRNAVTSRKTPQPSRQIPSRLGVARAPRASGQPLPPASHKGEWFSPEHHPAPDPSTTGGRAGDGGSRRRRSYWDQKLRVLVLCKDLWTSTAEEAGAGNLPELVPMLPFQPAFPNASLLASVFTHPFGEQGPSGGAWPALTSIKLASSPYSLGSAHRLSHPPIAGPTPGLFQQGCVSAIQEVSRGWEVLKGSEVYVGNLRYAWLKINSGGT